MYKNIIILCADDMGYPYESKYKDLFETLYPNLNECCSEGFTFHKHNTNISVCQPSRSVMMTGMYPFNNGALGFSKNGIIKDKCKTMVETLNENDIESYIIGKAFHYAPINKFKCKLFEGFLDKKTILVKLKDIFNDQTKRKVLFLNSPFPHRDGHEYKRNPDDLNMSYETMPPTIINDIDYINEYKKYILASKEFDDLIGMVRNFIRNNKLKDTLFIITSDNTIPFPYYKGNCYRFSSHVPLVFVADDIKQGDNKSDFVTVKDMMPTLLELLNITHNSKMDGKSFVNLLKGDKDLFKEYASFYGFGWTDTNVIATNQHNFFTASYHNDNFSIIENCSTKYEGAQGGADAYEFKVLKKMILKYPEYFYNLHKRDRLEVYDTLQDPFCRKNLIKSKNHIDVIEKLKKKLEQYKFKSGFSNKNVIKCLNVCD